MFWNSFSGAHFAILLFNMILFHTESSYRKFSFNLSYHWLNGHSEIRMVRLKVHGVGVEVVILVVKPIGTSLCGKLLHRDCVRVPVGASIPLHQEYSQNVSGLFIYCGIVLFLQGFLDLIKTFFSLSQVHIYLKNIGSSSIPWDGCYPAHPRTCFWKPGSYRFPGDHNLVGETNGFFVSTAKKSNSHWAPINRLFLVVSVTCITGRSGLNRAALSKAQ